MPGAIRHIDMRIWEGSPNAGAERRCGMNLMAFLEKCDPDTKVAISNGNGTGGAAYLAWPEQGLTAKEAIDEFFCGLYHVCGFEVKGDMLYIFADENPWGWKSYWDGEWYGEPTKSYEFRFNATVTVMEPNVEAARRMAAMMVEDDDFDYALVAEELVLMNVK